MVAARVFLSTVALSLLSLELVEVSVRGQTETDNCTSGFTTIERMEAVLDNYITSANNEQQAIVPEMSFSCNGSIRTLIFGAVWSSNRPSNIYTELQIWRPVSGDGNYTIVGSAAIVTEQNTTLLYHYSINETSPLHFQQGDIIGFYQPFTQLRLQLAVRMPQPRQNVYFRDSNPNSLFNINNATIVTRRPRNLLLNVQTVPANCGTGFMSMDTMRTLLGLGEVGRLSGYVRRQQITPGIKFTCDGMITKWIVGAFFGNTDTLIPELQIWRNMGNDTYKKLNGTFLNVVQRSSSLIYEYDDFAPISFQAGDILGAFIPQGSTSRLRIRSERGNGPVNYFQRTEMEANSSNYEEIEISGFSTDVYHLLVTVEIAISTGLSLSSTQGMSPTAVTVLESTLPSLYPTSSTMASNTADISPSVLVPTGQPSSTPLPTGLAISPSLNSIQNSVLTSTISFSPEESVTPSTTTRMMTTFQLPSTSVGDSSSELVSRSSLDEGGTSDKLVSSTPAGNTADKSSSETSQSSLGAGVGGGVGAAVALVLLIVCVLGVCVLRRRRKWSKVVLQPITDDIGHHLDNPMYEGKGIHSNKSTVEQDGIYDSPYTEYESVDTQQTPAHKETREFDNPLYSDTGPVTCSDEVRLYETTEFGGVSCLTREYSYVPTIVQRKGTSGDRKSTIFLINENHHVTETETSAEYDYATTRANGGLKEYFKETNIYWQPASTVDDLYEQLSRYKYREIPRQHIEVGGSLGSGQFGVVSRGKWQTVVGSSVDVAIKTLRPSAKETDKVKFLQEAAINGQFRHPNIVQLHGVVTVGEPVMIVLEYLPNGDLRNFLHSLINQADPPQQSDLSQLCLSFSHQVASGMSYLAGKAFVHRDLAARNILVSENTVCKVADFGMARDLHEDSYYVSHGGQIPVKWTAPEALHYKKYSTASDVWSFGCLMYEIWSVGHKPFEGYTNSEVLDLVTKGYRLAPPPGCPRHIYSIMMNCWNSEKSSRPSFQSLCQSLAGEPATLLQWREEDSQCHPKASLLGAELEAGKHLYTELQQTYLQIKTV